MAELLLEELGKGLKAGGVIEKLVKIRRPSSNSTNVLFGGTTSCLLLGIGMLQNIRELRTKAEGEQCQKGTDDTWVSGMMEAESLFLLSLLLPVVVVVLVVPRVEREALLPPSSWLPPTCTQCQGTSSYVYIRVKSN